jgi:Protein of unknown function (DUF2505)
VRFEIKQPIKAPRDAVMKAVVDPRLYESMGSMPSLGPPSVLECTEDGSITRLRIRYRFEGQLSRAARAVLDPAKMTWVVELEVDKEKYQATFLMIPDHYKDRMKCSGSYRFEAMGDETDQLMQGEMVVSAPLVAGLVERAILVGFREHMGEQAKVVERFAAGIGTGTSGTGTSGTGTSGTGTSGTDSSQSGTSGG